MYLSAMAAQVLINPFQISFIFSFQGILKSEFRVPIFLLSTNKIRWNAVCGESRMHGVGRGKTRKHQKH